MDNLKNAVKAQYKRNVNVPRLIEAGLKPQDLKDLKDLLRDPLIQLASVHRVLIERGILISYSTLIRYRDMVRSAK